MFDPISEGSTPVRMSRELHVPGKIRGMSIGCGHLLIAQQMSDKIRRFDLETLKPLVDDISLKGVRNPWDLLALEKEERVVVSEFNASCVLEFSQEIEPRKLATGCRSTTLAETWAGDTLVTCPSSKKLIVFSSMETIAPRTIDLDKLHITPTHAVQLSTGEFVVSDKTDKQHRVVKLDTGGRTVVCEYGGASKVGTEPLNMPVYLVRCRNDFILVADQKNDRILLLSHSLELVKELISPKDGLSKPTRMCLDPVNRRLFVVEQSHQNKVIIFSFASNSWHQSSCYRRVYYNIDL